MRLEPIGPLTSLFEERFDELLDETRAEGREQGVAEGREQGVEDGMARARAGERERLGGMAALKFGADAAQRFAAVAAGLATPEQLRDASAALIECSTLEALLGRVADIAGDGNGAHPA